MAKRAVHGRDDRAADGASVFVERRVRRGVQGASRGGAHAPAIHAAVTHAAATLVLCTAGRARFEMRGAWSIEAGDVLLVPPGEPHRRLASEDAELWTLGFCVPCFAASDDAALLAPLERVRAGGSAITRLPPERLELVVRLFGEVERADAPAVVRRSVLALVLHEVSRHGPMPVEGASSLVGDALRYIEQHCLRALTLGEVAHAVGRSPAHLTTAVRRATGRSVVEWIVAGRMAEARRRLLHTDEYVDVIAERVGYADPTHFIRMFRREHGQTPLAWRASRRPPPPERVRPRARARR